MTAWVESMQLIEKIFFFVALPATLIMVIQTITLFIGGSVDTGLGSDTSGLELDTESEFIPDGADAGELAQAADAGLRFLTMRSVITFMTVFGWAGLCMIEVGLPVAAAIAVAVILGVGAMVGVAFLIRGLLGLQASGNINYREALGKDADVYLTVPPKGAGHGKVTLAIGGKLSQYDAVTEDTNGIKTGEVVRVTDIIRGDVMVVERDT